MDNNMVELEISPFVKCIVLKVDIFETHIIDEANFSPTDEVMIEKFASKYIGDNYIIIKVKM